MKETLYYIPMYLMLYFKKITVLNLLKFVPIY